jgi:hypothetical protein
MSESYNVTEVVLIMYVCFSRSLFEIFAINYVKLLSQNKNFESGIL